MASPFAQCHKLEDSERLAAGISFPRCVGARYIVPSFRVNQQSIPPIAPLGSFAPQLRCRGGTSVRPLRARTINPCHPRATRLHFPTEANAFSYAVIPTGVARPFLACGLCTPRYAAEEPLFDCGVVDKLTSGRSTKLVILSEAKDPLFSLRICRAVPLGRHLRCDLT